MLECVENDYHSIAIGLFSYLQFSLSGIFSGHVFNNACHEGENIDQMH